MKTYHKIQTVYKRDPETKYKTLLEGQYSIPEFEYLKDNEWVWTEKVDGTNIRIQYNRDFKENIEFNGKTDNANMPGNLVNRLNDTFLPLHNKFKDVFGNSEVCLYGEGYGAGIQKGGGYRQDQDFVLFDVKIEQFWLRREDVEDIAISLEVDIVPIIGSGTLSEMVEYTREGFNSTWGDFQAEGIVARPKTELCTRNGSRMITKIKCVDFN